MTEQQVNESRFHIWRGVVAMAHADGVVTPHEMSFINDYVTDMPFSKNQRDILSDDLRTPKDIHEIFAKIETSQDKKDFFALARALSWCDGDYDAQEKYIIETLEKETQDVENAKLLKQSRDNVSQINLSQDQWHSPEKRNRGVFDLLAGLTAKTA